MTGNLFFYFERSISFAKLAWSCQRASKQVLSLTLCISPFYLKTRYVLVGQDSERQDIHLDASRPIRITAPWRNPSPNQTSGQPLRYQRPGS